MNYLCVQFRAFINYALHFNVQFSDSSVLNIMTSKSNEALSSTDCEDRNETMSFTGQDLSGAVELLYADNDEGNEECFLSSPCNPDEILTIGEHEMVLDKGCELRRGA